jgi:GT2 family glycosyltransferase
VTGVARATAIVVAHEGGDDLVRCVRALLLSRYAPLAVLVADNASTDGACERVEALGDPRVRVLRLGRNRGFAAAVNAAVASLERGAVGGDDVHVLVNQDCTVEAEAVGALVARLASDARIAIAGARILDLDGVTVQHAGGVIRPNGLTEHVGRGIADPAAFGKAADVEYVTGALCAVRAWAWTALGPLDERYRPVYFEEVDFCVRAREAGMRVVYEPAAVAVHAEASSSGGAGTPLYLRRYHRNRLRFLARHRLRRGSAWRTLAAEARWLAGQRRLSDVAPAVRAYLGLAVDLAREALGRVAKPRPASAARASGAGAATVPLSARVMPAAGEGSAPGAGAPRARRAGSVEEAA